MILSWIHIEEVEEKLEQFNSLFQNLHPGL